MKKRILSLFSFLFLLSFLAFSQTTVKGKITDANTREVLIGATIQIEGTSSGTTTDLDGNYQLVITNDITSPTLIISYTGYEDVSFAITNSGGEVTKDITMNNDPLQLKEVVVTARKVQESLQTASVSAIVLDAIELKNKTISAPLDALELPNVIVEEQSTPLSPIIVMRGLWSDATNPGIEAPVGTFIDGIYVPRPVVFGTVTSDIERIEALRGPQGTVYGKSTTGGVVNLVTQKPKDALFGGFDLTYGNYNLMQARAHVNFPLGEKVSGRVSGMFKKRGGFFEVLNPEVAGRSEAYNDRFSTFRAQLRFQPSDELDINLSSSYGTSGPKEDIYDFVIEPAGGALVDGGLTADESPTDYKVFLNGGEFAYRRLGFHSMNITYDLGNATLTSLTGYQTIKMGNNQDADGTEIDVFHGGKEEDINFFSEELRIHSPIADKFSYIGGIYFASNNHDTDAFVEAGPAIPLLLAGLEIPDFAEKNNTISNVKSTTFSPFISIKYKISDAFAFRAGGRFTSEKKDLEILANVDYYDPDNDGTPDLPIEIWPPFTSTPESNSWSAFAGDLGLDYKLSDNAYTYFNIVRGFKAGGYNVAFSENGGSVPRVFDPEYITSFELGAKTDLLDNRLRLNAAVFLSKYTDKQEFILDGLGFIIKNASKANLMGIEVDATAILAKGLTANIGLGYTNPTYDEFINLGVDAEGNPTRDDLSGNILQYAAKTTFNFSPQYYGDISDKLKLLVRADVRYRSEMFFDVTNTFSTEGVTLVNARIGLETTNGKYGLALWAKNLTDKVYPSALFDVSGIITQSTLNNPMTLGVELRVGLYK